MLSGISFRRVWITGGVSSTVRWMEILAVGLFTLQATESALMVAVMLFLRQVPITLFGILAGAIAERADRRRILTGGLLIMAVLSGCLSGLAALGFLEVWMLGIGAFISGLFWTAEHPVRRTLLADASVEGHLGTAMALDSATSSATRIVGPPMGGALLAFTGIWAVYAVSAFLYIGAWLLIRRLEVESRPDAGDDTSVLTVIGEGFSYIRTRALVAATLAVTVVLNLFGFAYGSMVPVIGEQSLQLDEVAIGSLMSMEGFGALCGALSVARFARPHRYTLIYVGGAALFLCTVLTFSFVPTYWVCMPLLFAGGFGIAGFASMQGTLILSTAARAMRARLMGVLALCIGAGPIGLLHLGWLADRVGAELGVRIIAIEGLVTLLACLLIWPALRQPHHPAA